MSKLNRPDRRAVLAAGLAVTAGFISADIRAALAQAVRTGKPMLTQETFNAMLQGPQGPSFASELATTADLPGFLSRFFSLSSQQAELLGAIPMDQLRQAQALLEQSRLSRGPLKLVSGGSDRQIQGPTLDTGVQDGVATILVNGVTM